MIGYFIVYLKRFNKCLALDRLLFVINAIKEEIVQRVADSSPRQTNMTEALERLVKETLGEAWRCG